MHVKLTTSGGRRYVQLVESYRDEAGQVKKRTVATLGRAEQVAGVAAVTTFTNVYLDAALLVPTAQIGAMIDRGVVGTSDCDRH